MGFLSNFQPETIAFWLGFLAATVFWWLAGRLRALLPRIVEALRKQIRASRRRSQDKVDETLRRETLRAAQGMHLTASLFALDEILVPPALIAPPVAFIRDGAGAPTTVTGQVVPYLPDWPQMASPYPGATITLAEAIQNGIRVVVIGQPGCGKTTALAALASQMARKDAALGSLTEVAPLLVHVLDLALETVPADPLDTLLQALSARSSVWMQRQIPAYLRAIVRENRLVLLLDGLDELPPEPAKKAAVFLESLFEKYPKIRAVTTASADCIDGLAKLGFVPLALAGWKQAQCKRFVKRWGELWTAEIAPEISRRDVQAQPVDPLLLNSWLTADWEIYTPLEWTLRVWGAYAGDLMGPSMLEAEDAYVRRVTGNAIPAEGLARLATEFLIQGQVGLSFSHLEHVLAKFKYTPHPTPREAQTEVAIESDPTTKKKAAKRGDKKISSGGRIVEVLLDGGLLVEHAGGLRLVSPVFTGLLASLTGSELALHLERPVWCAAASAGQHLAARGQGQVVVQTLLEGQDDPLYSRMLLAARWLSAAPLTAEWRPGLMRKMLQLTQQDNLPTAIRARLVAAFACSNDPSIPLLFKQFLASGSPELRQLAALGSGVLCNSKLAVDLTGLMADPVPQVRAAACLAMAAYGGKTTTEILPQVLMHGEETLQLAAAEALSCDEAGQKILKDALQMDNLMVRRAAVLALAQARAPWALKTLEKVAVEDAQWVVRSAAGEAVENLQKPSANIPLPPTDPWDAGWLIAFAGKQGVGIIPGHVPVDLLVSALAQGTLEEKLGALIYLKDYPDETVLRAISRAACSDQALLREAGQYTQWYLQASGVELPAVSLY